MKIIVWTVAITHRHGQDIHVAESEDAAEEILARFCRLWWEELHAEEPCEAFEKQHGRRAMIAHYFDLEGALDGSESADIEGHELEIAR